jgi:hypothetical protein
LADNFNNFIKTTEKDEVSKFKFLEHDIAGAFRSVKRTSQGAEPLSYWIFKQCSFELGPIIAHLYNLILSTSVSPMSWKHSLVTPIPKVTPPRDYSDLRPISITPILSRIYDRIYDKLFDKIIFLKAIPNNIVDDQFPCRPTGSTTAALSYLFHEATIMLLNMAIILNVFLLTLVKLSIRYLTTNY